MDCLIAEVHSRAGGGIWEVPDAGTGFLWGGPL